MEEFSSGKVIDESEMIRYPKHNGEDVEKAASNDDQIALKNVREVLGISHADEAVEGKKEELKIEYVENIPGNIEDAKKQARDFISIQQETWLTSYTQPEYGGISRDDVLQKNLLRQERIDEMAERLVRGDGHCVAARVGDQIVGFAEGKKGEEANIGVNLQILPEFQGKGIGTELMKRLLNWLGDEKPITLNVAEPNVRARRLYERFGFVKNPNPTKTRFARFPGGKEIANYQMIWYPTKRE